MAIDYVMYFSIACYQSLNQSPLSVLAKSLGVTSAQLHFLLEEHFAAHSSVSVVCVKNK